MCDHSDRCSSNDPGCFTTILKLLLLVLIVDFLTDLFDDC